MSWIVAEYRCPLHGRWDEIVERPAPELLSCQICGVESERVPSAPRPRVLTARPHAATTAKTSGPPSPYHMDTEPMADGETYGIWSAKRDRLFAERRASEIDRKVGT